MRLRETTFVAKQGNTLRRKLHVEEPTCDVTGRPIAWTLKDLEGYSARWQLFRIGALSPVLSFQTGEEVTDIEITGIGEITLNLSAATMDIASGDHEWALELRSDTETVELPEDGSAKLYLLRERLTAAIVAGGDTLVTGAGDNVTTGAGDQVVSGS